MPIQWRLLRGRAGLTLVRERGAIYRSFVGLIMFSGGECRCVRHKHCPRDVRSIPDSDRRTDVPGGPKRTITRSSQRPSVHLSSFKPRQLRWLKEKTPEGCEAWSSQATPADCRAWKVSSIKKSAQDALFFAFIGKDATDHRRPYTSRTTGRSTSNAGGKRKRQRQSMPRS